MAINISLQSAQTPSIRDGVLEESIGGQVNAEC